MIIKFPVKYTEEYYPTKRCKKARKHLKTEEVLITVPTITREDDFPIAFKVTNYETVYPRVRDSEALHRDHTPLQEEALQTCPPFLWIGDRPFLRKSAKIPYKRVHLVSELLPSFRGLE